MVNLKKANLLGCYLSSGTSDCGHFLLHSGCIPPALMHTETIRARLPRIHFLNIIVRTDAIIWGTMSIWCLRNYLCKVLFSLMECDDPMSGGML
ncbi:hypothetical protein CDAR_584061 [Caerostris darwini]|uniref:Uncharacterized protein n=1 Tax=Caerostris darwini TaxID=1538125 RepID=A0AAV4W8K8_9ARAC|nr:hypothetical protein CDAR_584061 [Caerostris darwini]